jgi:hypothetical protein
LRTSNVTRPRLIEERTFRWMGGIPDQVESREYC